MIKKNSKELEKSIDMLIKDFFIKADNSRKMRRDEEEREMANVKHDFPQESQIDRLIGPAELSGIKDPNRYSPTSPDYGMQPIDMRNEQGRGASEPRMREQKSPTSPDYAMTLDEMNRSKDDSDWREKDSADFSPTSPDLGLQPEKTYEEMPGDRGRSKDVHYPPNIDEDRSNGLGYDFIQSETARIPNEFNFAAPVYNKDYQEFGVNKMKKGQGVVISKADYALLQNIKKAQTQGSLKKSQTQQQDLIKSVIASELQGIKKDNEELKKALTESTSLLKKMSSQPIQRKSIPNMQVLEKSFVSHQQEAENKFFNKSQVLDTMERLIKANKLPQEALIEFEMTGDILNKGLKQIVEQEMSTQKK